MLKRKLEKQLSDWKNDPNRMPLVVKGARQVGKTFSIEEFCWANGLNDGGLAIVKGCFDDKQPVPASGHKRMLALYKEIWELREKSKPCRFIWQSICSSQ